MSTTAARQLAEPPLATTAASPLPLAQGPTDEAEAVVPLAAEPAHQSPVVLVIDDDLFVCRAVACILRQARAVTVHAARDGAEALQIAALARPDLILLDIKLPGMSALDICRALRRTPDLQGIPVCVLTGLLPDVAMLRDLQPFVDQVLTKPPDPRRLIALLDEYGAR